MLYCPDLWTSLFGIVAPYRTARASHWLAWQYVRLPSVVYQSPKGVHLRLFLSPTKSAKMDDRRRVVRRQSHGRQADRKGKSYSVIVTQKELNLLHCNKENYSQSPKPAKGFVQSMCRFYNGVFTSKSDIHDDNANNMQSSEVRVPLRDIRNYQEHQQQHARVPPLTVPQVTRVPHEALCQGHGGDPLNNHQHPHDSQRECIELFSANIDESSGIRVPKAICDVDKSSKKAQNVMKESSKYAKTLQQGTPLKHPERLLKFSSDPKIRERLQDVSETNQRKPSTPKQDFLDDQNKENMSKEVTQAGTPNRLRNSIYKTPISKRRVRPYSEDIHRTPKSPRHFAANYNISAATTYNNTTPHYLEDQNVRNTVRELYSQPTEADNFLEESRAVAGRESQVINETVGEEASDDRPGDPQEGASDPQGGAAPPPLSPTWQSIKSQDSGFSDSGDSHQVSTFLI